MFLFAESGRLAVEGATLYQTRCRPLFFIPRAAILRNGALSSTFYPNAGWHEDLTIIADFSRRERSVRRQTRPPSCCRWFAGRRSPMFRDALSLSPFRLPEPVPNVAQRPLNPQKDFLRGTGVPSGRTAWRASIPSPGFSAGFGVSLCSQSANERTAQFPDERVDERATDCARVCQCA